MKKILIFVSLLLFSLAIYLLYNNLKSDNPIFKIPTLKEEMNLNIINLESKERPYAIMINNHKQARINHAGLNDAYIIYEVIVEGGLTRLMAIYKDKNTTRIGSVRSARHYFLDYALEHDAIYVHYGWSPQAESDINILNIDNINGLTDNAFYRDGSLNVNYEHTAFTSMEAIKNMASQKGYHLESTKETLLNYSEKEIILDEEKSISANNVIIPYSTHVKTSYTYDQENKVYKRYVNDEAHIDAITKEIYTTKNIIIMKVENSTIDNYGRQTLANTGMGDGYYITNGKALPITWSKETRTSQTIYKDINGEEININDGNTYIQIMPINQFLQIN